MGKFIVRRLLMAIPLLFVISFMVFGLIILSPIDPMAIYEDNPNISPEDRAALEYRLGLQQPAFLNFRGSNGTVQVETMTLYNLPGTVENVDITPTGELAQGTQVAVIDEKSDETNRWVKIYMPVERVAGWVNRNDLSIQVNPFDSRYFKWLFAILQGDFGRSNVEQRPALDMILERLPNTMFLMSQVFIVQLLIALPVGIFSAIKQYSLFDYIATAIAYAGRSIPLFWFGLLLIIVFHTSMRWPDWIGGYFAGKPLFPGGGMYDVRLQRDLGYVPWWDIIHHLVLPVTMLAVYSAARYIRFIRSSMLDVLNQDYIRTARSKGMLERRVYYLHAFKNAAIPLVTIIALDIPILFSGALFTETIFSWPGMGRLFFRSAERVDYSVLMGIIMINAVLIVLANLFADILYGFLDPRVRYS